MRELEDEGHVRRRTLGERLGQRSQGNVHVLAKGDAVATGKPTAGVDENGIPRVDAGDGLRDVRLRVGPGAHDDDVKPVRSQPATEPRERLPTEGRVAGARVRRSDDERQPHVDRVRMYDRTSPRDEAPSAFFVAFPLVLGKLQPIGGDYSGADGPLRPHDP